MYSLRFLFSTCQSFQKSCDDPAFFKAKKLKAFPAFLPRSIVKTAYLTWRKYGQKSQRWSTGSIWCSSRKIRNVEDLQTFFKLQKTSG